MINNKKDKYLNLTIEEKIKFLKKWIPYCSTKESKENMLRRKAKYSTMIFKNYIKRGKIGSALKYIKPVWCKNYFEAHD